MAKNKDKVLRFRNTNAFSKIALAESREVPKKVQILKVGKFKHPKHGEFEITPKVLSEMKANFDKNVRGIDLAVDYFHDSDKEAGGWFEALELRENNTQLWATVDWTPAAEKKLSERELRYFSPDFAFEWEDPESLQVHQNVLFGGGLTNRPFLKEMQAIVADEDHEDYLTEEDKKKKFNEPNNQGDRNMPTVEQLQAEIAELKKQIADMMATNAKMMSENDAMKKEKEVMMSDKKTLEEKVMMSEKTSEFNLLLSEGKACAAQKDAYLKGDMKEFLKLAQPLNTNGGGTSANANVTLTEQEKTEKILKLADEKQKADPKLNRGDAISIAKKEVEKA